MPTRTVSIHSYRGGTGKSNITANIAASVNLVEDGVRVINWSWGIHRVGTRNVEGDEIDSLVRSGIAMSGYEELLEEFFLWLREEHPNVVVVNSAGNGSSFSGRDEYRLPSSFVTDQLFVVGGHQRSEKDVPVDDAASAVKRKASNIDMRVDITAAACVRASTAKADEEGEVIISRHHVLGAEIDERQQVDAGDFLNVSFVAFRDCVR